MCPLDVVPVNPDTVDEWTHPPYSGYYDGTFECLPHGFTSAETNFRFTQ